MKKRKAFSKILAIVLTLSVMLTALPSFSVSAQETPSEVQVTEKGELWQPESDTNALNFEGDLSIEELKTAELAPEDTPEIVSAEDIESKGHVNRLWGQEDDLNSIVFQNRDGTKTMYCYNYPVKYKDENGKIKDKSNKLSQTSDGDYTNAENDINTYFPKKLNRNKGVELKFGEYVVEMAPDIKGNSGASRQTGHNKYFDPTEYVQYPDVFDESISLRYTPTFEGYKEDIVLSEYTGENRFSFRLYTDGLSLVMNDDGACYLIDPLTGEIKAQIGDLVVYDSKQSDVPDEVLNERVMLENSATEELTGNTKTYSHKYKIETIKHDNEYRITVVVDESYLTDSERVYPVYVDPTISVTGSGTGKTIQDAPVYSNKPSTVSGGNTYNIVGYQGSEYGVGRTLMKFPGLSSDSTYASLSSNQISSLQLHIYEGSGSTNSASIGLWQYTGTDWDESTARCGNIGWDNYSNKFASKYINGSGWHTFDLTSMVARWKSNPTVLDNGILMKNHTSESNAAYSKHFMSTESSCKPYLTYTYNVMPTQVTLSQTSNTIGVGESFNLYATVSPSNSSQIVYWDSSDDEVATITSGGLVCAKSVGTTIITARSKLDNTVSATCEVVVRSKYQDELINLYGFSEEESQMIISVYDSIDDIYTSQSNLERAWRSARLLSEFVYDNNDVINQWDDVAGSVTTISNRETYFVETLGFTTQQYSAINTALNEQHSDSSANGLTIDFCHMQYSLAARLAYTLGYDYFFSNWGTGIYTGNIGYYSDEDISYLAGWFGDAVLTNMSNGTTSFGNDDYMSDLDAENIYHIILQGSSSINAISNYYTSFEMDNNRSHIFTNHISYETVRDKVFYELIDADLYALISANQDNLMSIYYANLLSDEEYHWNILKNQYYDTYNFLNSLRYHRPFIENY